MSKAPSLNKEEVAARLIGTAIRMYFSMDDEISAHLIVCAGWDISQTICRKRGLISTIDNFKSLIHAEHQKEAIFIIRKAYNYFKHANDPDEILHEFRTDTVKYFLLFAIYDFRTAFGGTTPAMFSFFAWLLATHPHLIKNPDIVDFDEIFPNIRDKTVEQQRKDGLDLLNHMQRCAPLNTPIEMAKLHNQIIVYRDALLASLNTEQATLFGESH